MFNVVLDSGYVPYDRTIGVLCPIYTKKGSTHDPDNYRPITLLTCPAPHSHLRLRSRVTGTISENLKSSSHTFTDTSCHYLDNANHTCWNVVFFVNGR